MVSRGTLLILGFAVMGGLAGLLLGRHLALPPERPAPAGVDVRSPGQPLPQAVLPDLAGSAQGLAQWRGRPLLINFWATWCAPCIEEMPVLEAFRLGQPADGIEVLGIALDEADAVRAFLADAVQVSYPILLGGPPGPGDLSVQLGNVRSVLPFSVLVDRDHRIVATRFGEFDAGELSDWVGEHL